MQHKSAGLSFILQVQLPKDNQAAKPRHQNYSRSRSVVGNEEPHNLILFNFLNKSFGKIVLLTQLLINRADQSVQDYELRLSRKRLCRSKQAANNADS